MQSIQFDIEKLGLGSRAVAPPTGAGGFDEILGRTRDDMPRPDTYGSSGFDRSRREDRPERADRPDPAPQRDGSVDERRDRSREETAGPASDDTRARSDQSDKSPSSTTDRPAHKESSEHTAKEAETDGSSESSAGKAPDTVPGATAETAVNDSATGEAQEFAPVPEIDQAGGDAIQQSVAGSGGSNLSGGDIAVSASAVQGQVAANPALQRGPQRETPAQSDRHAGNGPVPGAKAPTTVPQGQDGKGPQPGTRLPNSEAAGLELSVQKAPATSGASTQMSSATALGVLQEQAVAEAQKAEGENKLLLRTSGQQKGSLAAELGGSSGQSARQGGDPGQQKGPATGQLLNTPATGGQGSTASGNGPGQSIAGMVMPTATGAEAAPALTPSGQPIPAALAGNPTGMMQAAIQAAAPGQFRQGPSQQGPAEQVSVQIQTAVKSGVDRISIQLSPADLGKIDVKMELGEDGQLRAIISAEKPETLELLQRDARGLEKSLQDAGLKTDMNSLAFQKGGNDRDRSADERLAGPSNNGTAETTDSVESVPIRTSLHDGSLDISV